MAEQEQEEKKPFSFKPVDVEFNNLEGTYAVKDVETPEEEEEETEEEESQEEETQEEESQEEESDDEDADDSDDSDDDESDTDDSVGESNEDEDEDDNLEEDEDEDEEEEDAVEYSDLPESVQKYLDFLEETNGSMEDFIKVNRDISGMSEDQIISEYMTSLYPELDAEDIAHEIDAQFGIVEDDSAAEQRAKKIAKKKFLGNAKKSLKEQADKWKVELGSSATLSAEAKEAIEFKQNFEKQNAQSAKSEKAARVRRSSFVKETNKVFGKDFKGFEVEVGDSKLSYKPEDVKKMKEQNLNVNNLLGKFTDKEGNVTDVAGYHKALTFASDPDAVAAHFYELGKAAAIEEEAADSKNISSKKPRKTQNKPKAQNSPKFKFVDLDGKKKGNGRIKLKNY